MASGVAIRSAMNDVTAVPKRKLSAPKWFLTGSQASWTMKPSPNFENERLLPSATLYAIAPKRTTIAALLTLAFAAALVAGTAGARGAGSLNGAGATFPAPLIALWQQSYHASTINYNPIGSGGGIQAITNKQVDFGASDAPLTKDQFAACPCVQIPWALSATSVPYNIPGTGYGLHMTGPLLADIYLGKVDYWDNPKIKKINPGKSLPHVKITPIFRSDGSGTTYNFTDYLSKVSREFRNKVGNSTQVNFPAGIGARGSSGVAAALKRTEGGLTYVDVAYSLKNHFKIFKIQN